MVCPVPDHRMSEVWCSGHTSFLTGEILKTFAGVLYPVHRLFGKSAAAVALLLSACATPRMHSELELSTVEQACGLSTGELVQEDELKKVLFLYRVGPTPAEKSCVAAWARKNHLHLAYIDSVNWTPQ